MNLIRPKLRALRALRAYRRPPRRDHTTWKSNGHPGTPNPTGTVYRSSQTRPANSPDRQDPWWTRPLGLLAITGAVILILTAILAIGGTQP